MDFQITEKFDNNLLHRKEVKGWVTFSGATPSNEDIRLQIATVLSTKKELVVIDHIYNTYGAQEAKVFAKAYEKQDFLDRYEPKKKTAAKPADAGEGEGSGEAPAAPAAPAEGKKPPEAKPEEGKPAEDKPAEAKPAEEKAAEEKPSEGKQEEKPAEEKPKGKGEAE